MFGLSSQLKRAVVSIPANIAEGQGAGTKAQFVRYLDIAKGSLSEVEYYLVLAKDLEYISDDQYKKAESLRAEVGFLLYRLISSMKK
jgi:four helix bundle protein